MSSKVFGLAVAAALALVGAASAAPAPPAGNPGAGKQVFDQICASCHNADKGGENGAGPNLYGVYGDKAANVRGFRFSAKMKASKLVWTPEQIDTWLKGPDKVLPGTKMSIDPIKSPKQRADLIAFLRSRSDRATP